MSFRSPLTLLLAAALVPLAVAAFAYAARRRGQALRMFLGDRADAQATAFRPLVRHRQVRAALIVGALACVGVALAGPRIGTALREGRAESLDLIVALDVSDSMRADDVAPSRLDRAKLEIRRVVDARRGDRVGLVVFAGDAFLQSPLTTDRGALKLFLDAAGPEQIGVQGTDFARALEVAALAFDATEDAADRPRALLVVSDGEDHEGGLDDAADRLRSDGVAILALGLGTDAGAPVPDVRRGRVVGTRRDRTTGRAAVTTYQEGALRDLADGGVIRVGARPAAPRVNAELDDLDRAVVAQDEFAASAERFQWPLALALLLLLAERVVALRRAPALAGALALALVSLSGCGDALDALRPGEREGRAGVAALADSAWAEAEQAFIAGIATPDVARDVERRLWQGLGVARARQDRWAEADSAFAQALARAATPALRARSAYDAGTAALRADDPARADSLLRIALLAAPDRADARRNQEIARRRLGTPLDPPEPSAFAREQKARADSLVAARQYGAALDVMSQALERDSSAAVYAEFAQRLSGVVQIQQSTPEPPDSSQAP